MIKYEKGSDTMLSIKVNNPQRRSLKAILLLFIEPYTVGARDTEKYFNPDITKVNVTINGSPNRIYNNGIDGKDIWTEISRFFATGGRSNMNLTKYLADNKFGLLIDLRSMVDTILHGTAYASLTSKTVFTFRLKEWPLVLEIFTATSTPLVTRR